MERADTDAQKLQAGAKIFFVDIESSEQRIALSDGTIDVAEVALTHEYFAHARVPRGSWRPPTVAEHAQLVFDQPVQEADWSQTVLITPVPNSILDPLRAIGFLRAESIDHYRNLFDREDFSDAVEQATRRLIEAFAVHENRVRPLGVSICEPKLVTVATDLIDPDDKAQGRLGIGLHVDAASPENTALRAASPNRIAVNVGFEDRYLLFLNLPVADLLTRLSASDPERHEIPDFVALDFMQTHPHYPVVRVLLRPGEAYIAPTDNLVHDGSSLSGQVVDVSLHILGDFALPQWTQVKTA